MALGTAPVELTCRRCGETMKAGTPIEYRMHIDRGAWHRICPRDVPPPPSVPGAIRARYAGRCARCHERYPVGTEIVRHPEGWGHVGCEPAEAEAPQTLDVVREHYRRVVGGRRTLSPSYLETMRRAFAAAAESEDAAVLEALRALRGGGLAASSSRVSEADLRAVAGELRALYAGASEAFAAGEERAREAF